MDPQKVRKNIDQGVSGVNKIASVSNKSGKLLRRLEFFTILSSGITLTNNEIKIFSKSLSL